MIAFRFRLNARGATALTMLLASALSMRAATLRVGVAQVDITPPTGAWMWGFAARKSPSTGTRDPLLARIVVFEAQDKRVAIVALDLGRTFGRTSLDELRQRVRKSSGISYVFVTASHTHSGPVIQDRYKQGTPPWESDALGKIAAAIDEAHHHTVDARLGTGYGITYIGYNRLRPAENGTVTFMGRNPTKVPTSPVDPTVSVLRIDDANGRPLAILVNYACHPVIFGGDSIEYSADFPAVTVSTVQNGMEGKPLCLFVQGAAGDINPFDATTPLQEGAVEARNTAGRQLGEEALRVAKTIHTEAPADPQVDFREDAIPFALRWDPQKFREATLQIWGPAVDMAAPPVQPEYRATVATILIDRQIALMGMSGEPYVDFQIDWRMRCPVRDAFFAGYANGYDGYLPTIAGAIRGSYGGAGATTWLEVGAGERMLDRAVIHTWEMLGRLSTTPQPY